LYSDVTVSGVSLGYFIANEKTMLAGRYFNDNEMSKGEMVAIISDKAVNNMFEGNIQSALGSQIQVCINNKYVNYTIIGVYEYETSGFGFSSASEKDVSTDMYIPLNSAMSQNHTTGYATFTVVTTEGIDVNAFVSRIEQFMNVYYRNNNNFEVSAFSMASILDTMTTMMSTITTAIAVIAGIALVVGGIGVMNIMLVSITERTREIGTRKALGATNSSIRLQFIVEAMVICLVGGIIGIILGIAGGAVGAKLLGTAATSSLGSIFLSLGFSMAIGIFFGYYPANKAAKMDPIEALRYE
jgi:putative ABC transport system permease protein